MDPAAFPQPPVACGRSYVEVATAACGAAMEDLCSGATVQPDVNGNESARSILLDPATNCARWKDAVEVASVLGSALAPGAPHLDAAIVAYCHGPGISAPECNCVNFPIIAATACQSSDCPDHVHCALDQISQSRGPNGAELEIIQFASCNPSACWLASCYDSNSLLTSDIVALQTGGGCQPYCILEAGTSNVNTPTLPPSTYSVNNSATLQECGTDLKGPLLTVPPMSWKWAANSLMQAILPFSNDGDVPAIAKVTSVSVPWATVEPADGVIVAGRTVRNFVFTADRPTLAGMEANAPGGIVVLTPSVTLQYPDAEGVIQTTTANITITVAPPGPRIQEPIDVIPWWFYAGVVGVVVLVVVLAAVMASLGRRQAADLRAATTSEAAALVRLAQGG